MYTQLKLISILKSHNVTFEILQNKYVYVDSCNVTNYSKRELRDFLGY